MWFKVVFLKVLFPVILTSIFLSLVEWLFCITRRGSTFILVMITILFSTYAYAPFIS